MNTLAKVRNHLRKQHDVKRTSIVTEGGRNLVKATIENVLHNGSKYRRIVYYDHNGNLVSP